MSLTVSAVVIAIASLWLLQQSHGQDIGLFFTPSDSNTTVFVGGEFSRFCSLTGSDGEATFEWLFNNNVVTENANLVLLNVSYEHIGEYFCRATLSGDVIGPDSGGFLNVLDPSRVVAPPIQYALLGSSITLQCETDFADTLFTWINGGQVITTGDLTIEDVSLADEDTYICRVLVGLGVAATTTDRPVQLKVIVPPEITSQPSDYTVLEGPSAHSLEVTFRSRSFQNTTVSWFHDTSPIPESLIQTAPVNDSHGTTALSFLSTSRSDDGVYRVVVENNFPAIPEGMRSAEISFQLRISFQPALPVNLRVAEHTNPTSTLITWTLTNQNADNAADSLTLTVGQPTIGENDRVYLLSGTETETAVDVFPGMEYAMSLSAQNRDGDSITNATSFPTPAREPLVSSIEVSRVNQTAFQLTVNVDYTGGGDITLFTVTFRKSGSNDAFSHLGDIPASPLSVLVWNGVITSAEFASLEELEFEITVSNERSLSTTASPIQEATVLPGAPVHLSLVSYTTTSLTITVQLSQVGTQPILHILLRISGPVGFSAEQNATRDFIFSGETLQLTVEGLSADTEYRVEGLAVNRAGAGPSSEAVFTTRPLPSSSSLPLWVIVVIVVGSVVAMVALLTVVCVGCCIRRRRKNSTSTEKAFYSESNTYVSATAEDIKLDPSHEMLKRQHKGFMGLSAGPLTPRSPTTTATPITVISAEDIDGSQFKFDNISNNSDDSDTTFPRYTYRVSPSPGDSAPSLTTRAGSCTSDTLLSPPPRPSYATDV